MPPKPKKPCNQIGCRELTTERYCTHHQHKAESENAKRHRYYDKYQRDKKADAFYHSKEWEQTRLKVLTRDHHLCQHCLMEYRITTAEMVHHIKPLREYWGLRVRLSNLISLCNSCHSKIPR